MPAWIAIADLVFKLVVAFLAATWTVALLFVLRQRELAQANLRKSEIDIKHVEKQIIDLELMTRQAVIMINIESTVRRIEDAYIVLALVEITNCGTQNACIRWKHPPRQDDEPDPGPDPDPAFNVRRVKLCEGGCIEHELIASRRVPMTYNPASDAYSHVVRAGGKETLPFAVKVPSPGLYLLSFRGVVDKKDRIEAEKLKVNLPVAWTGNRHVLVGDPLAAGAAS
jgi:hypothetical protein